MSSPLRLMAVLAHPDDETLGVGGALAACAARGVATHVVTATRGQAGRHGEGPHPGTEALGERRESELRAAARELNVREVTVLDYMDGELAGAEPKGVIGDIVRELRRVRPQVVLTFAHDGAYGHADHIAVSQFTTSAVLCAADESYGSGRAHRTAKLYYMAWDTAKWDAYQAAFKKLTVTVDGVVRQAVPWPDWSLTTQVDARPWWRDVWRAVHCHQTQMEVYDALDGLSDAQHETLWGRQTFYRVMSTVNGGRSLETDLFEGIEG